MQPLPCRCCRCWMTSPWPFGSKLSATRWGTALGPGSPCSPPPFVAVSNVRRLWAPAMAVQGSRFLCRSAQVHWSPAVNLLMLPAAWHSFRQLAVCLPAIARCLSPAGPPGAAHNRAGAGGEVGAGEAPRRHWPWLGPLPAAIPCHARCGCRCCCMHRRLRACQRCTHGASSVALEPCSTHRLPQGCAKWNWRKEMRAANKKFTGEPALHFVALGFGRHGFMPCLRLGSCPRVEPAAGRAARGLLARPPWSAGLHPTPSAPASSAGPPKLLTPALQAATPGSF